MGRFGCIDNIVIGGQQRGEVKRAGLLACDKKCNANFARVILKQDKRRANLVEHLRQAQMKCQATKNLKHENFKVSYFVA